MSWEPLPTPNPSEFAVRVWVSAQQVTGKLGTLVSAGSAGSGTTLDQMNLGIVPTSEGFGGYVYVKSEGPRADDGRLGLTFVKTRTTTERDTPFDEGEETEDVDWLAVCKWIDFKANYGAPRSQNTMDSSGRAGTVIIPRWVVRRDYVHGQRLKTRVRVRKFLSETSWPAALIESDEPMGTEISWDLEGNNGSTGRCLHDEKTVPGQGSAYAVVNNAGNPESASGSDNRSQYFPKTNHLRWQDFTTNDVKWIEPRFFLRIERTYIAPNMPEGSLLV